MARGSRVMRKDVSEMRERLARRLKSRMFPGLDSNRRRNAGAGIGSISFWFGMTFLVLFFGWLSWPYVAAFFG